MSEFGPFEQELARIRASRVLGRSGRLLELFDYLAARGPHGSPATQAEIAHEVFGAIDAEADDATARVYVHRLRRRISQFYRDNGGEGARLTIPAGCYQLTLEHAPDIAATPATADWRRWAIPLALLLMMALAYLVGREAPGRNGAAEANEIWQPFIASERPIMVAVGDYYIFGELDSFDPEKSRMIRDFAVNGPTDLARAQETNPERYERAEDMGLSYLPISTAYALRALMPVLAAHRKPVQIMPASQVDSQTLRDFNIVYLGLVGAMGLLEDVNFMGSGITVGETYDELIDARSGRHYVSEEALSLASSRYYRDYGYVSRFREPGGALVAVVAGARDTGLRGLAPLVVAPKLAPELARAAKGNNEFEAIYEITGQQGADLSEQLDFARQRP